MRDRVPDQMPVLSRGKHRSPRSGSCFMEMASVLAGERWSDRPSCTHPLLATLARLVNDQTSDAERGRLALLIPSVVGIRGGDVRWVVGFATTVAAYAIVDVPESAQRALAAGLVRAEQVAATLDPQPVAGTEGLSAALDQVPWAVAWARDFGSGRSITHKAFVHHCAPTMVKCAVNGIVGSVSGHQDERLLGLLQTAIATAIRLEDRQVPLADAQPRGADLSRRAAALR